MLVLCSDGLTSRAVLDALRPYTRKLRTAALVVTADNEYKKDDRHVPRCTRELESLGLTVDVVDIDDTPCEKLLAYDAVECIGGNPFYLLYAIRRQKGEGVFRTLAEEKLLIGWSAAAFVFGPSLELVKLYTPQMNSVNLTDLRGLELAKIEVLPHYSRFLTRFDRFEETCREYEQSRGVAVQRLNDGDAVLIDKGKVRQILGSHE